MVKRKHSNFDVYDQELNALYKSVVQGRRPGTNKPGAIMSDPLPSIPKGPSTVAPPPKQVHDPKPPGRGTRLWEPVNPNRPGFGGDVINTETGEKGFFDMKGDFRQQDEPYCYHDGCNRICRTKIPEGFGDGRGGYSWTSTALWCDPRHPNPNRYPNLDFVPPNLDGMVFPDDDDDFGPKLVLFSSEKQKKKRRDTNRGKRIKKLLGEGIFFEGQFVPKYKLDQNPTKYGLPSRIAKAYRPRKRRL